MDPCIKCTRSQLSTAQVAAAFVDQTDLLYVCVTVKGSIAVSEHRLLPSGLLLSCVPWSYLVLSCAGFCRFGLLLSWLLLKLSLSSVVSSCRVPCCLVFSSLGPSVLSLGASWKPLWCLRGELLGPPGALRGPLETDCGPLNGWTTRGGR